MKVCEIIDEFRNGLLIGYLFYYERDVIYSVELNSSISEDDMPLFFLPFVKRGKHTISPDWSRRWVETRVIPRDRQGLGIILKNSGLKYYDMFKLLIIADGRCSQDDCAIRLVKYENLPDWVIERRRKKLGFAARLSGWNMLLTFRDGSVNKVDLVSLSYRDEHVSIALDNPTLMDEYKVMAGGTGLTIGGSVVITAEELYGQGEKVPLSADELKMAAKAYIMDTRDVCDELHCSRQYVSQLTKDSGLSVLKDGGTKLYGRSDVNKVTE